MNLDTPRRDCRGLPADHTRTRRVDRRAPSAGAQNWTLIEMVEAATHCRMTDIGTEASERLAAKGGRGGSDSKLGLERETRVRRWVVLKPSTIRPLHAPVALSA